MFYVILLYAISASTFVFSKFLLTLTTPLFLTGLRTFFAGSILLIYLKTRKNSDSIKKYFISCIPIALCSFFAANSLKFWSLQYLSSANASLIWVSEPIFAGIIAYILCNEKINFKQFISLLICIGGSLSLIFAQEKNILIFQNWNSLISLPVLILILAVGFSALGAILFRIQILKNNSSAIIINGISMFTGGCIALFASFSFEKSQLNIPYENFFIFILLLTVIIILSNIFAYNLYGTLLKKYSVMFISCASFTKPFFTDLYSWILYNKVPSLHSLLSASIIFIGIYIFYKSIDTENILNEVK